MLLRMILEFLEQQITNGEKMCFREDCVMTIEILVQKLMVFQVKKVLLKPSIVLLIVLMLLWVTKLIWQRILRCDWMLLQALERLIWRSWVRMAFTKEPIVTKSEIVIWKPKIISKLIWIWNTEIVILSFSSTDFTITSTTIFMFRQQANN